MGSQLAFRFYLLAVIFGGIGTLVALSEGTVGLLALLMGFAGGLLATELHVPNLLREWEETGVPGGPMTPEQQEQWEQGKGQRQRNLNLAVVVGLFIVALLRSLFKERLLLPVSVTGGGLAAYFLRVGWLIHQRRGKKR